MIEVICSLIAIALIIAYGVACYVLGYKIRQQEEKKIEKSCKTCKHRNLADTDLPCFVCYMASDEIKDYYEPYTEKES